MSAQVKQLAISQLAITERAAYRRAPAAPDDPRRQAGALLRELAQHPDKELQRLAQIARRRQAL